MGRVELAPGTGVMWFSLSKMVLFRYFQRRDLQPPKTLPDHTPQQAESGMNVEQFRNVSSAVSDLADPRTSNKRAARGKYTVYTDEDQATIGKYAC